MAFVLVVVCEAVVCSGNLVVMQPAVAIKGVCGLRSIFTLVGFALGGMSNAEIAAKASNTKLLLDLMSGSRWDFCSSYCRSDEST